MFNIGFLLIFLLIQVVVNSLLNFIFTPVLTNIYGWISYELLYSLIIAFFAALISTPSGYRKSFFRQPGFHKYMLMYFVIFAVINLLFLFI